MNPYLMPFPAIASSKSHLSKTVSMLMRKAETDRDVDCCGEMAFKTEFADTREIVTAAQRTTSAEDEKYWPGKNTL